MKRTLLTILALMAAGFVAWAIIQSSGNGPAAIPSAQDDAAEDAAETPPPPEVSEGPGLPGLPGVPGVPGAPADRDEQQQRAEGEAAAAEPALPATGDLEPIEGLHVVEVTQRQPEPVLGEALPDSPYMLEARFTPWGGGIMSVRLSRYSTRVDEYEPYPVQRRIQTGTAPGGAAQYAYPMAALSVRVNGGPPVPLSNTRWEVVEGADGAADAAAFAVTLADGEGRAVLRLLRRWRVAPGRYDLRLEQELQNLSDRPLRVVLTHYGPGDMEPGGGYIERRQVVVCYRRGFRTDPQQKYLTTEGLILDRDNVVEDEDRRTLWPQADAELAGDRELVWAAMTNRYFAAAVHGAVERRSGRPVRAAEAMLESGYAGLSRAVWGGPKARDAKLAMLMHSDPLGLAAAGERGAARSLDVELYAGPADPAVLKRDPVYTALRMGELVVYNLGGWCAFCTFAWLANFLKAFLGWIAALLADWGVAIIVLVAVVRVLLHPLLKRSQLNMMKMGKQMQAIQPEVERLKEKYKDNPQKMNQEQMRLFREKGINPAGGAIGCLPMVLQMPIWIALYAVLYFAIELRHEPAFWGVFQRMTGGDWLFMADLSSEDCFISLPESWHFTVPLVGWEFTCINLLPILMAVVFYFQQRYMTPPAQTEQARMQQQIMRWTVFLFPIFFYKMPCGLTLYILTSTTVGIVESRRVRAHLKQLEDTGKLFEPKKRKGGGFLEALTKAAEERQRQVQEAPGKGGRGKGPARGRGKGKGKGPRGRR